MAIRGLFIGIGKHADRLIHDVGGASKDAVALHALFSDTIANLDGRLLCDEQATLDVVRAAIASVLDGALPEDTVIVSFSGHGTPDHRLALYDTERGRLPETGLPMEDLADAVKRSAARAVVCILDCCFSGAAPARVLDDVPSPTGTPAPLEAFAGKGRLLLAASNAGRSAYSAPGGGHGLLTGALLDALQVGDDQLDLPSVATAVMRTVHAEAARLGKTQTPVLFGFVDGVLELPRLRAGDRYRAAFPEHAWPRVSGRIDELSAFGIPPVVLSAWTARFGALNDLQVRAVNEHGVLAGRSVLVVAPTGAGKTFVGEVAGARAVVEGRKAVFLLPYKAIVNEKFDEFAGIYGASMRVVRCAGDFRDQIGDFVRGRYDIALLTYEMFLNLALSVPTVLEHLGLVVLDEAQFITDSTRGIVVELLLAMLITARARGINPQLIALSAVIGQINEFDAWLGARTLVTTQRPVPLVEGVLDRQGAFQRVDETGVVGIEQLLPMHEVRQRKEKPKSQDVIVPLVRRLVHQENETVIVFRNQRGSAEGCAQYLAAELGLASASAALAALPPHDPSSSSSNLRACLRGGTAFHTTNLTREERVVVERAFRGPDAEVAVLAATTTLAAGINTPASTVVLAEQVFKGDDGRAFTIAEYKNMAGRAGRPGFGRPGRAILLADSPLERERLFTRYVLGRPEPLRSSFDAEETDTWVLRLLTQVKQVPKADVAVLLSNTYGGYLASRRDVGWQTRARAEVGALIDRMLELGLAEQEGDHVQLSLLGRTCGRSSLAFRSCMRLIELLRVDTGSGMDAERLMLLVQVLPEMDATYTPLGNAPKDKQWPTAFAARTDTGLARALQRGIRTPQEWSARCKRGMVLLAWVHGVPIEQIESAYSANAFVKVGPGHVRGFADNTRFHLRSASEIARAMLVASAPTETAVEVLLKQLEVGIPPDVVPLLDLPIQWTRGECLALRAIGITSPADLWAANHDGLVAAIGEARAKQIAVIRPTVSGPTT